MGDRLGTEREARKDDAEAAIAPDADAHVGTGTRYTSAGAIPPVMAFPGTSFGPSASDRAFGTPPLSSDDDRKKQVGRMDAERLLTSKDVTSGQDAIKALDLLLGQPGEIDRLSQRAFDNLIDRLEQDQRARMKPLVDASQDPKRKLALWAAQHKGRARTDLARYQGDFGDPGDANRSDAQQAAQKRYDRRERGVETTEGEVENETKLLLAKGDKLTVKDVDALRERKDAELDVEMKHNINLVAEGTPRDDQTKSRVVWSKDEATQLGASLSKLPDEHVHDENSVEKYVRRANRALLDTRGGQYEHNEISIFDHSHDAIPGRAQASSVEYDVTHEVGHEVETENEEAFAKFQKVAGWETYKDRHALEKKGIADDDIREMGKPHPVGDKIYTKNDDGSYNAADVTAIPSIGESRTDRWKYAATGAKDHWAEVYAMAVETPDLLYSDLIVKPAEHVRELRETLAAQRDAIRKVGTASSKGFALTLQLQETEKELIRAEKAVKQRREIYAIIRNDVFHGDKNTHAAIERLKQRGATDDAIKAFEDKAARVSTPQQIAELERGAMR
jgi:hypothetical protein